MCNKDIKKGNIHFEMFHCVHPAGFPMVIQQDINIFNIINIMSN